MSAYIVFTRDKTTNQEELDVYDVKVKPTLGTFGMKPRAIYGKHKVLEGAEIEGMVIIEFPTFEEASAWYESPAYQAQGRFEWNLTSSTIMASAVSDQILRKPMADVEPMH
jgi:uncharacterized protein (DUF1330 family)